MTGNVKLNQMAFSDQGIKMKEKGWSLAFYYLVRGGNDASSLQLSCTWSVLTRPSRQMGTGIHRLPYACRSGSSSVKPMSHCACVSRLVCRSNEHT